MPGSTVINDHGRITVKTGELQTVFLANNYMATAAVIGCLHDDIARLKAEQLEQCGKTLAATAALLGCPNALAEEETGNTKDLLKSIVEALRKAGKEA